MNLKFVAADEISLGRRAIAKRFLDQCLYGAQLDGLPSGVRACGQQLGSDSKQRGLHGTAAALRVLAQDREDESRDVVPELIAYVQNRSAIELGSGQNDRALAVKLERDAKNVIKISELIYALSFVEPGVAPRESLQQSLVDELIKGKVDDRGWDFFTDVRSQLELLPTAHAVRALSSYGSPTDKSVTYLLDALHGRPVGADVSPSDISVRVFCLFVLAFPAGKRELAPKAELKNLFLPLWTRLEGLLYDDLEQNIEYSRKAEHFYVRVPYQLYLLPLAAKLAPLRAFASIAAQARFAAIISAVNSPTGFLYPHSGRYVSSRTNAIVYDTFSEAGSELVRSHPLFFLAIASDRVRRWLASRTIVWAGYIAAFIIIGISVHDWWTGNTSKSASLGPNFVAPLILLLLSMRKRR